MVKVDLARITCKASFPYKKLVHSKPSGIKLTKLVEPLILMKKIITILSDITSHIFKIYTIDIYFKSWTPGLREFYSVFSLNAAPEIRKVLIDLRAFEHI